MIIASIILTVPFLSLIPVFMTGKGDMLIAGYNTATEEKRKQIDIHRLRLLMAIMMMLTAVFCGSLAFIGSNPLLILSAIGVFTIIAIIFIILANTWAKKK